jgi:hypothetical protein
MLEVFEDVGSGNKKIEKGGLESLFSKETGYQVFLVYAKVSEVHAKSMTRSCWWAQREFVICQDQY